MGDRYIVVVQCPKCNFVDNDAYYAPTCGFMTWKCAKCGTEVDLEKYTGISVEECSNRELIENIMVFIKQ